MTAAIDTPRVTYTSQASAPDVSRAQGSAAARSDTAAIVPMDPNAVRALSEEAANRQQSGARGEEGRTGAAPIIELPASTMTQDEASAVLAGIINRLPAMLLAHIGAQDPIKTEEGAPQRAAEVAATQLPVMARTDGPPAAATAAVATGMDADIAAQAPNVGVFFKLDNFVNLLIALRDILLQFEELAAKNSADMTTMRLQTSIVAGELQVKAAVETFSSAIASGVIGGAIGAAAVKKTFEATSIQTKSLGGNLNEANRTSVASESLRGGAKAHTTPSAELRPSRNLDGRPVPAANGNERPPAQVQGDLQADISPMNVSGKRTALDAVPAENQEIHSGVMAQSQIPLSHATLLNMIFPAVTSTIQSGGAIYAQTTTVESDLAKQAADIHSTTARTEQEALANNRAFREATAQLFVTLLGQLNGTNQHIIEKV